MKIRLLLVAFIAAAMVLAGCQSPSPEPTATNPPQPTPTATSAPAPTPTAAPAPTSTSVPTATSAPSTPTAEPTPVPTPSTLFGVSLSPLSYSTDDFTQFLGLVGDAGGALRGGQQWSDLNSDNQPAQVVLQLANQRGYTPVIETSFFIQDTGALTADVTDPTVRQTLVDDARAFADKYKPPYLSFAVEVNILQEKNPAAFDAFANDLFPAAVKAVHEVSPDTKVFVTFQLEHLMGMRGGLFGGTNDPNTASWDLLDRFPDADMLSFTTYPGLIYHDASELPDNYYSQILDHTDKPIAFTEIGWMAASVGAGWDNTPESQAAFVTRLGQLLVGVDPKLVMWAFLFDQSAAPVPFDQMGLYDGSGAPRPAWQAWQSLVSSYSGGG